MEWKRDDCWSQLEIVIEYYRRGKKGLSWGIGCGMERIGSLSLPPSIALPSALCLLSWVCSGSLAGVESQLEFESSNSQHVCHMWDTKLV